MYCYEDGGAVHVLTVISQANRDLETKVYDAEGKTLDMHGPSFPIDFHIVERKSAEEAKNQPIPSDTFSKLPENTYIVFER